MSKIVLPTYSFADFSGIFTGPGGTVPFGYGTGSAADEGIDFEMNEDYDKMTIGAGGDGMHGRILNDSGRVSIHCLKTSPINAAFDQMLRYQKTSSLYWGINTLTGSNPVTGDRYTCTQVAFSRRPRNSYAKDPNQLVWEFNAINVHAVLGAGVTIL